MNYIGKNTRRRRRGNNLFSPRHLCVFAMNNYSQLFVLTLAITFFLFGNGAAMAHVGSPEVFYEGKAGPYDLLVSVLPPDVVPGIAAVSVHIDQDGVNRVGVQPIYFSTGIEGAPRADEALPTATDARLFTGKLWLMEFGSSSVRVSVEGAAGSGEVIVPVPAVATARRTLDLKLGFLLAALGLFLFAGAVSVIGACSREAVLVPGNEITADHRKRARRIMFGTAALIVVAAFFGNLWWGSTDGRYLRYMYKPIAMRAAVREDSADRVLRLVINNVEWLNRKTNDFIPDHGKLMHLFLVRDGAMDAFAHLHPVRVDEETFDVALPPLPQGRYLIFADVVHKNGLSETLTAETDLPAADQSLSGASTVKVDADDAWRVGETGAVTQPLADGSTINWERAGEAPLAAGRLESLRFSVKSPDGSRATLEPYMGMSGHAVILRDDGSVFVHVHPVGTVSMASQEAFAARVSNVDGPDPVAGDYGMIAGDEAADKSATDHFAHKQATDHSAHMKSPDAVMNNGDAASVVSFPYSFPKPGHYRVWVQVKREGRVLTSAFDANVQ